jgi:hypothetical protein
LGALRDRRRNASIHLIETACGLSRSGDQPEQTCLAARKDASLQRFVWLHLEVDAR